MAHSENAHAGGGTSATGPVLRGQLAIEPHTESRCAVANAGADAREVTHHLKSGSEPHASETGAGCGECHTELAFDEESERERAYLTSTVQTSCICPVFQNHDCIPQIQAVQSGSIIVRLTVPRREVLREIITDLRSVGATVSVEWLVAGGDSGATTEIDVNTITDKQQEALELAHESGYYETPRETDLTDLAGELGISESAASQRLNAAETKLVKAFLDE